MSTEQPPKKKNPGFNWDEIGKHIDNFEEDVIRKTKELKEAIKKKAEDSQY